MPINPTAEIGQEVALGGDNSGWLLVDQFDGKMVHLLRTLRGTGAHSAGFWIDTNLIREVRWPQG